MVPLCHLKRLNQAKIIKKLVILIWLFNMIIYFILLHMVILRIKSPIFLSILAWSGRFNYHILSEWRKPLLLPRGVQETLFPIFIITIIIFTTLARY